MAPDCFKNLNERQKAGNYTEIIQNLISVKVDPNFPAGDYYRIKSLNLTEFSPSYITFNITFEYPNSITTSVMNPDSLLLQFLNAEYFVDMIDYGRVINDTSLS
jgi:hypothetical protein